MDREELTEFLVIESDVEDKKRLLDLATYKTYYVDENLESIEIRQDVPGELTEHPTKGLYELLEPGYVVDGDPEPNGEMIEWLVHPKIGRSGVVPIDRIHEVLSDMENLDILFRLIGLKVDLKKL